MGVTLRRVGFGVLTLTAVLLPLRGRKPERTVQPVDDRSEKLLSLVQREHSATYLWSALETRDIALTVIKSDAAANRPPQVVMRGFPAGLRAPETEALVTGIWKRIGPTDSTVRTAVVVYNSDPYRSQHYLGTLITRQDGKTWCVAITSASVTHNGGLQVWQHWLAQALGPCTFLAAFGIPGSGVASWLAATRYAPAQSDDWLARPKDFTLGLGPWAQWDQGDMRSVTRLPLLIRAAGSLDFSSVLTPPYEIGTTGLRCIVGEASACTRAVLHSTLKTPRDGDLPTDLTVPNWVAEPDTITVTTVRPPIPSLMSAMVTDHDRARFRHFWRSDRPVDEAFRDAFGESLGAWTARWAAREWQGSFQAKYRGTEILLGVTLQASWPLLVIVWNGVALLVAASVARRRTA
jgi:hypothetical protein